MQVGTLKRTARVAKQWRVRCHQTAAIPKQSPSPERNFHLRMGGRIYVNPEKFEKGSSGEDAFFVLDRTPNGDAEGSGSGLHQAFGVADGVGDWVFLRGVDSAQYSRQLMEQGKRMFAQDGTVSPKDVIARSYEQVKELDVQGSSTICVANFDCASGMLSVANLGDSGLFVVRSGRLMFQTKAQNHIFGVPYQLSSDHYHLTGSHDSGYELSHKQQKRGDRIDYLSARCTVAALKAALRERGLKVSGRKQELIDRLAAAEKAPETDTTGKFFNVPDHADTAEVKLQVGDIVVAASDGFFDNVDPVEAAGDIWTMRAMETSTMAKTIARHALEVSRGAVRGVIDTPFSRQATEELNMVYRGGKLDDITVVVAKVYAAASD